MCAFTYIYIYTRTQTPACIAILAEDTLPAVFAIVVSRMLCRDMMH